MAALPHLIAKPHNHRQTWQTLFDTRAAQRDFAALLLALLLAGFAR